MNNGRVWMWLWAVFFLVMVGWSIATVMWWMDSVRNLNALSVVANVVAAAAGLQSTFAMRKADRKDPF
jgi:hypothetical protein